MVISLSPELARFVERKLKDGRYASASDVVETALERLMQQEREQISGAELAKLAAVGQAEADRGELLDAEEVFEELRQRSVLRRGGKR